MRTLLSISPWRRKSWIAVVASLLVAASLAGCFGGSDDDSDDDNGEDPTDDPNETSDPDPTDPDMPEVFTLDAVLTADRISGWADNDTFTFDASNSSVASGEGEIVSYTFDFGDGNETSGEDAVVEYTYERGGIYQVNLTVTGEGSDGNETSQMDFTVALVAQRYEIGEEELEGDGLLSILLPSEGETQWNETYNLSVGATAFVATLNMTDATEEVVGGEIEGWETFGFPEHPDGAEIENETFSADDFDDDGYYNHTLQGALEIASSGEYYLNVGVETGAITFKGTLDIYYGINPEELGI